MSSYTYNTKNSYGFSSSPLDNMSYSEANTYITNLCNNTGQPTSSYGTYTPPTYYGSSGVYSGGGVKGCIGTVSSSVSMVISVSGPK